MKIKLCSFALTLILCAPANAQTTVVKLLTKIDYMPYSYIEDNQSKGLFVEMVQLIDNKLPEYEIVLEHNRWGPAKAKIMKGEALGLIGPYFHAHDWEYMYPYSIAIDHDDLVTVCNDAAEISTTAQWPNAYSGLKIGSVAGYDGWRNSGTNGAQINNVNFFEFPNVALALKAVANEIVDCTLFEQGSFSINLQYLLENESIESADNISIKTHIRKNPAYIGYSVKAFESEKFPYAQDFKRSFDTAFYQLLKSGEFDALYKKYELTYY